MLILQVLHNKAEGVMPAGIVVINCLILLTMAWLVWYNYKQSHNPNLDGDVCAYHFIMFSKVMFFLFANVFAFFVNYYAFYVQEVVMPETLWFLRWLDRLFMFIQALYHVVFSKRKVVAWAVSVLNKKQ